MIFVGILAALACGLAVLITGLVRRHALRASILDIPNARSSHVHPTPRGGGIAIVVVSLAAMVALALFRCLDTGLFWALAGGAAVAVVGHLDDRGRIGIVGRLLVHIAAATWATWWLGGMTELHWNGTVIPIGVWGPALAILGIVWSLNLFNFMDGIDGIAASEAVFMAGAGAVLASVAGLTLAVSAAGWLIAATSLGFLLWNWPPARIFMGDVGSGFLGFVLAVLALGGTRENAIMLPVWLILGGVFIVDATLTLFRRLVRRERFYEAHRSHAYQWLARRWNSHLQVTIACIALNFIWLAPWAWMCIRIPDRAGWFVAAALGPLVVLAAVSGAGRRESQTTGPYAPG
jgi:Fuc2NAc and GlcNAc transferase